MLTIYNQRLRIYQIQTKVEIYSEVLRNFITQGELSGESISAYANYFNIINYEIMMQNGRPPC